MILQPTFDRIDPLRPLINIGCLLDIPTGTYLIGKQGESILNGGLGALTGVVGIGNQFKSTLMHYMAFIAFLRMYDTGSNGNTYDTEINIQEQRLMFFIEEISKYLGMEGENVFENSRWVVTDKTKHTGDVWYDKLKEFLVGKRKDAKKYELETPFLDRNGAYLKMLIPTFSEVDSFSEFVTADVIKMQDDNKLGEKGANTVSMRQGLQKNRFLMEIPASAQAVNHYILLTAQIGLEFNMDPNNPTPKKLQYLKEGSKIKGVPEKFTFLMTNCWHCYNASPLLSASKDGPEYPRDSDDDLRYDTDLNELTLRSLRNKGGPSGLPIRIVVSQQDGILPSLSEFHYIKNHDRFGITGSLQNYALDLLPEVKLSRTTVRAKIDDNPTLQRALTITAELCQMDDFWHNLPEGLLCKPAELYQELKAFGYEWETLLDTRGYWLPVDNHHPQPFLSTMDLLRMRKGKYHPYWLEKDRKTVKKPYCNTMPTQLLGKAKVSPNAATEKGAVKAEEPKLPKKNTVPASPEELTEEDFQ